MDLEQNLPQTLVEQLNDETNIELFRTYFETNGTVYSREVATTSFLYDKQSSELVYGRGQQATQNAIKCYVREDSIGVNPESCTWENEGKSKFWGHGGGIERNILPLLEAIPTDNGLGLLKGALTVIFHAVKRRSDACQRIFTCFSEIPEMIAKGYTLTIIHSGKPEVASKVENLHNALFDSIPLLIDILLRRNRTSGGQSDRRRRWKRATDKVVRVAKDLVGDTVQEVEDLIAPITDAVSKLEDCATMLNHEGVEVTVEGVADLQVNVQLIRDMVKSKGTEVSGKLDMVNKKVNDIKSRQDRMSEDFRSFVNVLFRFVMEFERKRKLESLSLAPGQGADGRALKHRRREFPGSRRQLKQFQPAGKRLHDVDIDRLLEVIGTDDEHLVFHNDRDRLMRMQTLFLPKALRNAYHIMESKELGIWMSSPESELMIVDGACRDQSRGRVSPMTVLCASIAVGLAAKTASPNPGMEPAEAVVLFFACGEHILPSGLLPGPCGMMRSLISQLLIARDLPWNPSRDSKGRVRYERHPDLSFLAESATLWPEVLRHSPTSSSSDFTAGGSHGLQVSPFGRDKKRRRHDDTEDSHSDLSSKSDSDSDSDSHSDSDSDYDYTTGTYKPDPQHKPHSHPKATPGPNPQVQQTHHLDTLLTIFTTLTHQLAPHFTLHTIIDGISHYETTTTTDNQNWHAQTTHLLHRLATDLWLDTNGRNGPTFKLLLTSPGRSRTLLGLVRDNYVGDGALCVDMAVRGAGAVRTRGEYMGIRGLGVERVVGGGRPRSSGGSWEGSGGRRREGVRREVRL
ncbi:uncharacterized protein B0H64DRAFT_426553 [Chaetomium fimeti]|uniref:Uncharacterized protein n=1 Tax=Chaetomium fimeti TaxID=1854472 RepID=A0AAE0H9J3_9PEZI|nr:hypothetical protein B0H64DRAFT_426553 [Chaetomium fimeti]